MSDTDSGDAGISGHDCTGGTTSEDGSEKSTHFI